MEEEFGDIMRVMLATAPQDEAVSKSLAAATARTRQAFGPIAQRLSDLGALRDGLDVNQAVDVLWFYFGYSGLLTLHNDNGWPAAGRPHRGRKRRIRRRLRTQSERSNCGIDLSSR